jgi:hypothetical protein
MERILATRIRDILRVSPIPAMKFFYVLSCLALAACSSLPPQDLERSRSVDGLGVRAEGEFVVFDRTRYEPNNLLSLLDPPASPPAVGENQLLIGLQVYRVKTSTLEENWEGAPRRILLEGELYRAGGREGFSLEMRYDIERFEQTLAPRCLPADFELYPVSKKELAREQSLPFLLAAGTWKKHSIIVLCTRDYLIHEKNAYFGSGYTIPWPNHSSGSTPNGWYALLSGNQKFQIVEENDRVLGEVQKGKYRVFDTVSAEDISSMVSVLSVVFSMYWFFLDVDNYRVVRGPEANAYDYLKSQEFALRYE